MNEYRKPWRDCHSCSSKISERCLEMILRPSLYHFVRRQYPHDTKKQVESLHYLKLHALGSMFERLQPVQKRELGVTANVMLYLI
jgi:hypothetical protein